MNIGVIGAAGKAGTEIVREALERGHVVTAIVRHPGKLKSKVDHVIEKSIFDVTAEDVRELDVLVNAYASPAGEEHLHVEAGQHLIQLLRGTRTKLFVVGGAGSLFTDEDKTTRVMETPDFPKDFYPMASNQGKNLMDLENTHDVLWTFLSPSAVFAEGERTGMYQAGKDVLLVNSQGDSYVSYQDYAIAVLDEIEKPEHENERFTVTSEKA